MQSILFEKNLKSSILLILIKSESKTVKQLYYEISKHNNLTTRAIYKALNELLKQKIIVKHETNYQINPEWISKVEKDANRTLKKLLERNLLSIEAENLKEMCECGYDYVKGFCSVCFTPTCLHCGYKTIKHDNCKAKCLNCSCGNHEDVCLKCGKPVCLRCGKESWIHEHQFCKKQNNLANVAILEVDHDCWYSDLSEKHEQEIVLNNFSDHKDKFLNTHSGILKIEIDDKHKAIGNVIKQDMIKEARLIYKNSNVYYIKTRARINKSVDEFTKTNQSILLNPIIANNSKEQNLIISRSESSMKSLRKGLKEFGGTVKLICIEECDLNKISKIENDNIREFIKKVPKKELLESMQKLKVIA